MPRQHTGFQSVCCSLGPFHPQTSAGPSLQATGLGITLIRELSWRLQLALLRCTPQTSIIWAANQGLAPISFHLIPTFLLFLELVPQKFRKGVWNWEDTSPRCQGRQCRTAQPEMIQRKWGQRRHTDMMGRGHLKVDDIRKSRDSQGQRPRTLERVWLSHSSQHHDLSL